MKRTMVAVVFSAFAGIAVAELPEPAVWFRADDGVTVNADGKVTAWKNRGTLLTVLDVANAAAAPGITVEQNRFDDKPALRFDGNDFLHTAGSVDLGFSASGGAWFIVACPDNVGNSSLFGLTDPAQKCRFGVFRHSANSVHHAYFFQDRNEVTVNPASYKNQLLSLSAASGSTFATRDGQYIGSGSRVATDYFYEGVFDIGVMSESLTWLKKTEGEIAELRVYNAPLTAAETAEIEFELAVRYNLSCDGVDAWMLKGCGNGICVFGYDSRRLPAPATVETSVSSGDLTLSLAGTLADTGNGLVRVGNNGKDGVAGRWCVVAGDNARALPVTFAFTGEKYLDASLRLRRLTASGEWEDAGAGVGAAAQGVRTFTLPAGWASGQYALLADSDIIAFLPALWYRWDRGLTQNGAGKVTGWSNSGTWGADGDLVPRNPDSPTLTVENEYCLTNQAVSYSGSDGLLSKAILPFSGIVNGTCFIVMTPTQYCSDMSIFGTTPVDSVTTVERWGVFTISTTGSLRSHFFRSTTSLEAANGHVLTPQVLSLVVANPPNGGSNVWQLYLNGRLLSARNIDSFSSWDGRFGLGLFNERISWANPFIGRIAEFRFYEGLVMSARHAQIELELARRYSLPVTTVGADIDLGQLGAHAVNAKVIGSAAYRGAREVAETEWRDDVLKLTVPDTYLWQDGNTNELCYVASDGGSAGFAKISGSREAIGRTWYVQSASHVASCVFEFSCEVSPSDEYTLHCRANGTENAVLLNVAAVISNGKVTFSLDRIVNGTYHLERKSSTGMVHIFR